MSKLGLITKGIIKDNPTFALVLGMCPTLGTTTSAINGLGMGLATTFVLVLSNMLISAVASLIPSKVKIPCYIVIIASLVTVLQFVMQAYVPSLYETLSLFIPLIVVNCIILGRAEAFASKNGLLFSALDGVSMGIGFTLSLVLMGAIREGLAYIGLTIFQQTAGGFIIFGLLMALFNFLMAKFNGHKTHLLFDAERGGNAK